MIDVGSNQIDAPETEKGYRYVGDVEFDTAKEVAGYITKVPRRGWTHDDYHVAQEHHASRLGTNEIKSSK